MKFFARLDGDIVGIDTYIAFDAPNQDEAQQIADVYAEDHYSEYDEPFDEDESPLFFAKVEPWDDNKHYKHVGDASFRDYTKD
jgi:hypothetical protein